MLISPCERKVKKQNQFDKRLKRVPEDVRNSIYENITGQALNMKALQDKYLTCRKKSSDKKKLPGDRLPCVRLSSILALVEDFQRMAGRQVLFANSSA